MNILSRVTSLSLSLVILSGCTIDNLRPELNTSKSMRLFNDFNESTIELLPEANYPGNSPIATPRPTTGGALTGGSADPANFSPLPYSIVAADSYATYLEEKVYKPVLDLINKLPLANRDKVYFRVIHCGYIPTVEGTAMKQATVFDRTIDGGLQTVASVILPKYTVSYLTAFDINKDAMSRARDRYVDSLNTLGIAPAVDWLKAASTPGVSKEVLAMWGNERLKANTFSEYLSAINSNIVGSVPNISLSYYSSSVSKSSLLINPTSNLVTNRYVDHMLKSDINKLCCNFNAFTTRSCSPISYNGVDTTSALFAYIDGYTKTIVFLGVLPGLSIQSLFGNDAVEIVRYISGAKNVSQWADISTQVPGISIIQKGMKGVD